MDRYWASYMGLRRKVAWRSVDSFLYSYYFPEILETRQSRCSSAVGQRSRPAAETREAALMIRNMLLGVVAAFDAQLNEKAVTAILLLQNLRQEFYLL